MKICFAMVLALAVSAILLDWNDSYIRHDLIGTAIAYTKGFPFKHGQHAEILQVGLSDVRGMAIDEQGQSVFVAEANRPLEVYETNPPAFKSLEPDCLGGACSNNDRRGIADAGGMLYVAEHGRARIIAGKGESGFTPTMLIATESTTGPAGISVAACNADGPKRNPLVEYSIFYTDDRPWPGKPATSGVYDSADYSRWIDSGTPRALGGLYNCWVENNTCEPRLIADSLPHPSGVAAVSEVGPIFVAEMDSREVRWPIYKLDDSHAHWSLSGSLGSVPLSSGSTPAFLGIVLDDSHHFIFAAGPGDVHVFSFGGEELGVVKFEGSVTGIATRGSALYLIVGGSLCRLDLQTHLDKFARQSCKSSPRIAGTPSPHLAAQMDRGDATEPRRTHSARAQNTPPRAVVGGESPLPRSQQDSKGGCPCSGVRAGTSLDDRKDF